MAAAAAAGTLYTARPYNRGPCPAGKRTPRVRPGVRPWLPTLSRASAAACSISRPRSCPTWRCRSRCTSRSTSRTCSSLALAVPAAGFLLRTYIVFHDCAHGSFLPSRRANAWLGTALGLLVYSPFVRWRHDHAVHHATAGDLDRRGVGDVLTLTVAEYRALRAAPTARLPAVPQPAGDVRPRADLRDGDRAAHRRRARRAPRMRRSVIGTNIALAVLVGALCWLVGLARLPARPGPDRPARRRRRHLAVLRPAPVRGRLLAERRGLELRRRGAARQLLPEAAEGAPVLHRQHRPAPRPPPQRARSRTTTCSARTTRIRSSTTSRRSRSGTGCAPCG